MDGVGSGPHRAIRFRQERTTRSSEKIIPTVFENTEINAEGKVNLGYATTLPRPAVAPQCKNNAIHWVLVQVK